MAVSSFSGQVSQPPPRAMPALQDAAGATYEGRIFYRPWSLWFSNLAATVNKLIATVNGNLAAGYSGTISLAKLTGTGTNGSITVVNGIITSVVQPT